MAVIYCFGDSITYGAWDIERSGWASRLRDYLDDVQEKDESKYFLTYNLGIPGETTEGLAKRFSSELAARGREGEDVIFIFAYGANDSVFLPSMNEFRVSKKSFVSNLQSTINAARKVSGKIILINITPANEEICAWRYGPGGKVRLNENVGNYNNSLREFALGNSLPLVDVNALFMAGDFKKYLSEDGLHPNEAGHELIFGAVKTALDRML